MGEHRNFTKMLIEGKKGKGERLAKVAERDTYLALMQYAAGKWEGVGGGEKKTREQRAQHEKVTKNTEMKKSRALRVITEKKDLG